MSRNKNLWWKTLTSLALALVLSITLFATACGKKPSGGDDDDDNPTAEEKVDESVIKNGSFEFIDFAKDDDGNDKIIYPATTVKNFSRSTAATAALGDSNPASDYDSGIIDTAKIDSTYMVFKKEQDKQLEDLQSLELNARPGANEEESRILMIANKYKDSNKDESMGFGTAQKYTSNTTLTLIDGYAYKIGFWVKTDGLPNEGTDERPLLNYFGEPADGNAGAYIGINGKLNSTAVTPFYIENIDTKGEWEFYSFYIKASDFASTTVNLVVGLGFGAKDSVDKYVQGYAFFDDISYEVIPVKAQGGETLSFDEITASTVTPFENSGDGLKILDDNVPTFIAADSLDEKDGEFAVKADFSVLGGGNNFNTLLPADYEIGLSKSDDGKITAPERVENAGWSEIASVSTLKDKEDTDSKGDTIKPYAEFFENYPFESTDNVLILRARLASAFTFTVKNDFEVEADKYYAVSFFVKTTKIISGMGATLTVIDKGLSGADKDDYVKTSFSDIDTTSYTADEDLEDYLYGWKKFTFFIKNSASNNQAVYFGIELNFGLTTQIDDKLQYNTGLAAFTQFNKEEISAAVYERATADEFAKKVTIAGKEDKPGEISFDSIMPADKLTPDGEEKIENFAVAPSNYRGISGGTRITGGSKDPAYTDYFNPDVKSGLMDTEFIDAYNAGEFNGLIDKTKFDDPGALSVKFLGIYNTAQTAYGYVGKNAVTVSANSFVYISVDVLVQSGAKAFIYLTNNDFNKNYSVFDIVRPKVDGTNYDTEESRSLSRQVNGGGEWQRVYFFIATGSESKTFKVEFWNGSRDGEVKSEGLVLFKNLNLNKSLTNEQYTAILEREAINTDGAVKFIRQPDKFYDEENGSSELKGEYEEEIVFLQAELGSELYTFVNYNTLDVAVEVPAEEEEETPSDTEKPKAKANIWLLLSSIILAVALIASLLLVLARKLKQRLSRRKVRTTTRYHSKKKHYSSGEISEELDIIDDESEGEKDSDSDEI